MAGWIRGDGEGVQLTDSGQQLMDQHLLTKKAAALIDGLRVSVQIDTVGRSLNQPLDDLTPTIASELAAYISELESIKAEASTD